MWGGVLFKCTVKPTTKAKFNLDRSFIVHLKSLYCKKIELADARIADKHARTQAVAVCAIHHFGHGKNGYIKQLQFGQWIWSWDHFRYMHRDWDQSRFLKFRFL